MTAPAAAGHVLVGVDSGGSRTSVEVVVPGRREPIAVEVATSLSGSMTPAGYAGVMRRILAAVPDLPGGPVAIFISAAGYARSTRDEFAEALRAVVPSVLGGAITVAGVANDAPTLLLGHDADGVVIAGTGSSVLLRDRAGVLHQVGGDEWAVSDYGAGFWVGLHGIRRAYRDRLAGVDSELRRRLVAVLSPPGRPDEPGGSVEPADPADVVPDDPADDLVGALRALSVADERMKPRIAGFAAEVCAAAADGDPAARDVVRAGAEDLADVAAAGCRRWLDAADGPLRLVQCGSLIGHELYRTDFEARMRERLPADSVRWTRVATGVSASLRLAGDLADPALDPADRPDFAGVGEAWRPLVVRFPEP